MEPSRERKAEELLLRMGEFGLTVSRALSDVVEDGLEVGNMSVVTLCQLHLEGPQRPSQLAELEGMTTGGAAKLIDRMEADGLVERRRGVLAVDRRAVLVVITPKGRDVVRRMARSFASHVGDAKALIEEINALLTGY